MSSFERATLRWAKVAVGLSGVAALFICLQWLEMRSGGQDTHDLAVHAKEQADKMKDMSEAADKIRQAAENMVAEDRRIADNSHTAMEASNRQSNAALSAAIANSRSDQRAWVGLLYPIQTQDGQKLRVGSNVGFKFRFKNSGKTPARNVAYPLMVFRPPAGPIPDYDSGTKENIYTKLTGIREASVIAPGEEQFISFPASAPHPIFLGPKQIDMMNNHVTILYIVGKVTYNDVFPNTPQHTTRFCVLYQPETGEIGACPINNTMDEQQPCAKPNRRYLNCSNDTGLDVATV